MNFLAEPSSRMAKTGLNDMRHLPGHNTPPPVELRRTEAMELKREAKRQMVICRPHIGYLGNQYNYWENQYRKLADFLKKT